MDGQAGPDFSQVCRSLNLPLNSPECAQVIANSAMAEGYSTVGPASTPTPASADAETAALISSIATSGGSVGAPAAPPVSPSGPLGNQLNSPRPLAPVPIWDQRLQGGGGLPGLPGNAQMTPDPLATPAREPLPFPNYDPSSMGRPGGSGSMSPLAPPDIPMTNPNPTVLPVANHAGTSPFPNYDPSSMGRPGGSGGVPAIPPPDSIAPPVPALSPNQPGQTGSSDTFGVRPGLGGSVATGLPTQSMGAGPMMSGLGPAGSGLGIPGAPMDPATYEYLMTTGAQGWASGLPASQLAQLSPTGDPGQYARIMGQEMGVDNPDNFALYNQNLVAEAPLMWSLMNPGQTMDEPQTADWVPEYIDMMTNTPGEYLNIGGLYDNMFSPESQAAAGVAGPELYGGDVARYQESQIQAVMGAFQALAPYMSEGKAAAVQNQITSAIIQWQDAQLRGDTTDLITFLTAEGAEDWL